MKKTLLFIYISHMTASCFSQSTNAKMSFHQTHYLRKSKIENVEAKAFLGVGTACIITALIIPKGELLTSDSGGTVWGVPILFSYYKNDNIKGTFGGIGILSILTSIKFFLGSARNRHKAKKATSISFKNEKILLAQRTKLVKVTQPAMTLKISF